MFFDSAKLVHSAALSSNKITTANASYFVYTTLAEQTIAGITKLHLIMDTIFIENGIEYIRWTDAEGNTWTAGYEEVQVFGKECFEQMPEPEDNLGSWSVEFNLPENEDELIEVDNPETEEVMAMSWESFLKWCREQEIC